MKEKFLSFIKIVKGSKPSNFDLDVEKIESLSFQAGKKLIKPRSRRQADYFNCVKNKQMVFCCGPAGTGKTYLAVAFAVWMLKTGQIEKIILTRPAVEAGERLGFLPGDLKEKIDPYLEPIYDALNDMLSFSEVLKKIDTGFIEIAPLAFMRGRTLSNAFIILDESQNTTSIQMKMFLTRLGENSKMIINGDLSQVDLPSGTKSGLRQSINILKDVEDIGFIKFDETDVVRNPLVSKIVRKYDEFEKVEGVGKEYLSKYKKMIEIDFHKNLDFREFEIKEYILLSLQRSFESLKVNEEDFYISIFLTNDADMKQLNKKFRNINKSTNVLSFIQDEKNLFE